MVNNCETRRLLFNHIGSKPNQRQTNQMSIYDCPFKFIMLKNDIRFATNI